MYRYNFCRVTLTAVLFFICSTVFAQKEGSSSGEVWKKKVGRIIDMAEKEDNAKHHLTDANEDASLLEMMINAIKSGKITAYATYTTDFTMKMPMETLKDLMATRTDTITVVDPVTNTEEQKITKRLFDYRRIHKYRILEEWTFNPHTGKTEIEITGIAPLREIYDENNTFRGVQAMFWVHYSDVRSIITKYEEYHPGNTIAGHIWADYFLSDAKPEVQK